MNATRKNNSKKGRITGSALAIAMAFLVGQVRAGGGGAVPGDYGDAPDDQNARYASPFDTVIGEFPTLFATTNSRFSQPGGHVTDTTGVDRLGDLFSVEVGVLDASDPDVMHNLVDDDRDDGMVGGPCVTESPGVFPWPGLVAATLTFEVTIDATAPAGTRFLNVLHDRNRDGQWNSDPSTIPPNPLEWIVQDFEFPVTPGTSQNVTVLVNYPAGAAGWMRVALTRTPIIDSFVDDGSGWDGSGSFSHGEIEDYLPVIDLARAEDADWAAVWANQTATAAASAAASAADSAFEIEVAYEEAYEVSEDEEEEVSEEKLEEIIEFAEEAEDYAFKAAHDAARARELVYEIDQMCQVLEDVANDMEEECQSCECAECCATASAYATGTLVACAKAKGIARIHAKAAASAHAAALAVADATLVSLTEAEAAAEAFAEAKAEAEAAALAISIAFADADASASAAASASATASAGASAAASAAADAFAAACAGNAQALADADADTFASAFAAANASASASASAYAAADALAIAIAEVRANVEAKVNVKVATETFISSYSFAEVNAEAAAKAYASARATVKASLDVLATLEIHWDTLVNAGLELELTCDCPVITPGPCGEDCNAGNIIDDVLEGCGTEFFCDELKTAAKDLCENPNDPICGDGVCEPGETDCPEDCDTGPICGDGTCEPGEEAGGPFDCPEDCNSGCPGQGGDCFTADGTPGCDDVECCNAVCAVDPFCCDVSWDSICVNEAIELCQGTGPVCGDGVCEPGEELDCPDDCENPFICGDGTCFDGEDEFCPDDCNFPEPGEPLYDNYIDSVQWYEPDAVGDDLVIEVPGLGVALQYTFGVYGGEATGGEHGVTASLYDGHPCFGGTQIPGTQASWSVPDDGGLWTLYNTFESNPVPLPPQVFLQFDFDKPEAGPLYGDEAELGFTAPQVILEEEGTCYDYDFDFNPYGGFVVQVRGLIEGDGGDAGLGVTKVGMIQIGNGQSLNVPPRGPSGESQPPSGR